MKAQLSIVLLLATSYPAYGQKPQKAATTVTHAVSFAQVKPETKPQASIDKAKALKLRVDRAINTYLKRPKVNDKFVGMAVGVITGNDRHQFYYGETVKGNAKAPDHDTLFAIGSVTKTFTATLLALYNSRGKVRIPTAPRTRINAGTPVGTTLPPRLVKTETTLRDLLPAKYDIARPSLNITLEQLADHHSGLPRNPTMCTTGSLENDIDCMLKQLSTCSPNSDPQKDCHAPTSLTGDTEYSNYAFAVLSHLLARLHGRDATWIQALRDEILSPLGMRSTNERSAFLNSACHTGPCDYAKYGECSYKTACNATFSKRAAVGYIVNDLGQIARAFDQGSDEAVKGGSGVLWSTLDDQMVWLGYNMGLKYPNWKQEMFDILPELHTPRDGTHGLAWETKNWDGAKVINKAGGVDGFHAFIAFNLSRNIGVVVLVNCDLNPDEIARKILSVL